MANSRIFNRRQHDPDRPGELLAEWLTDNAGVNKEQDSDADMVASVSFKRARTKDKVTVKPASQKLWPGEWREKTATMLARDLDAAGIPYETEAGILDFHALRGTFATMLSKSGVSPKAAQELMRHSDIRLTMPKYTNR